jgi:Flp pilus assembly protein TadG
MRNCFSIARFAKDRGGNFGMMTAILLPVSLGVGGVAMDLVRASELRTQMQAAADAAALSAASAMAYKEASEAEAVRVGQDTNSTTLAHSQASPDETAEKLAQMQEEIGKDTDVRVTKTNTPSGEIYGVTITSSFDMGLNPLTTLLGKSTMTVAVTSSAVSTAVTESPISMYLVLDRSGSMSFKTDTRHPTKSSCDNYTAATWDKPTSSKRPCYLRKIEALQTAANALFSGMETADPKGELVRIGAVSYNHETQAAQKIEWSTAKAKEYVDALPYKPLGGTDASEGMKIAYNALLSTNPAETDAHKAKKHENFQRYILLMTDGEMTGNSSSWNRGIDGKVQGYCSDAKKDGIIIFSVAFMAPEKGQKLLSDCASGAENYYQPDNMEQLVKDFGEIAAKANKTVPRLTN